MIAYDDSFVECRGETLDGVWWQGRQWAVTGHASNAVTAPTVFTLISSTNASSISLAGS
jgi:hypothetical protein